ncbi:DUF6264 family protein [Microbacterium rhizosphaerae]|uniref:DUF6264 family protein n=1 Tax=Microbacterium rhizosphaerae TaxID=1678237 RepID=A0ABZ0SJ71_9MICO|nr:DUF6264 family protein [Microbacterium rhizosphaerae]WPR88530.1 DUF6264 family protein [Microbacterium rhizosphaerae]
MSTPDERPRPAYGEYATPEEQRARMQHAPPASPPAPAQPGPVVPAPGAPAARGHLIDRIVTVALLAYGAFVVVSTVFELSDFTAFADAWMKTMGITGSFTTTPQSQAWATAGVIVFAIGWIVTALISWRVMARGKRAWWIPLVGAVVSWIVLTICLTIPLVADPAVIHWFDQQTAR